MIKKSLLAILLIILIAVIGIIVFVYSGYDKSFDDEYPVVELTVEGDSMMIERGRYLAQGPAHCIDCHASIELLKGNHQAEFPLSGGFGLQIPPGQFYGPNLTSDYETGIGKYSDGELYRMLRYNIRPNGRPSIEFMPFINMSEKDIYSIIAYLRSLEPIQNNMPETEFSFLGKALLAFGAIKPGVPETPILESVNEDTTAEYGRYLAYSVANCRGCHTERDLKTGEFIGEDYAGGMIFGPDSFTEDWVFVTPNLTPDDETGIMADWDEETFIEILQGGRSYDTSPMPWEAFQKFNENDLKAIYRYLNTLEPINNPINNMVIAP